MGVLIPFSCQSNASIKRGRELAKVHCASCHQFPSPDLLDKATWSTHVLPEMGLHFGIFSPGDSTNAERLRLRFLDGDFPKKPTLTGQEWIDISKFYLYSSKETLEIPEKTTLPLRLDFESTSLHMDGPGGGPAVTAVNLNEKSQEIWIADQNNQKLSSFDQNGKLLASYKSPSAISSITVGNEIEEARSIFLTAIGFSIQPTDINNGYLEKLIIAKNGNIKSRNFLLDKLNRPVFAQWADITKDGSQELLVGSFGNIDGELTIFKEVSSGKRKKHFSYEAPGAISVEVLDFNNNGRKDMVALFAQGAEKVILFENGLDNRINATDLIEFPPSYGSTSIQLKDFNGDGMPDILYTCGDNADLSPILKPYHGIYIYLNKGNYVFEESYFYPFHGAYKAMAADFTGDGALDIVAISFFGDYSNPGEQGFVLLENKGFPVFEATTLATGHLGRWICMDVGDVDQDGDMDIVLGNYSAFVTKNEVPTTWAKGPHSLLLKNIRKNSPRTSSK